MMSVTVLIDKLTEIERSIGVEDNLLLRNQILDAQDCALRVQAEIAEMLRKEQGQNAAKSLSDDSLEPEMRPSVWRRAFVAILPLAAASPLWRR
jgi:hypothetical protein